MDDIIMEFAEENGVDIWISYNKISLMYLISMVKDYRKTTKPISKEQIITATDKKMIIQLLLNQMKEELCV